MYLHKSVYTDTYKFIGTYVYVYVYVLYIHYNIHIEALP